MASDGHVYPSDNLQQSPQQQQQQTRPPSGFISSFLHRRRASNGRPLPSSPLPTTLQDGAMAVGHFARNNPGALGELQHNGQESAPRSPPKPATGNKTTTPTTTTTTTTTTYAWGDVCLRPVADRGSPTKPKKTKSGTNLAGLLSRPKSLKNMYRLSAEQELRAPKDLRDKENAQPGPPTPVFAQFARGPGARPSGERCSVDQAPQPSEASSPTRVHSDPKTAGSRRQATTSHRADRAPTVAATAAAVQGTQRNSRLLDAFAGLSIAGRPKSTASIPSADCPEHIMRPLDIDGQLEDLLDRRNIPENQRYKMRNLNDTVKLEFIRQDWAEMRAAKLDRAGSSDVRRSADAGSSATAVTAATTPTGSDCDGEGGGSDDKEKPKRSRGRSFTFSRGKKESRSPSKKSAKAEGTIGRHLRSKSSDSAVPDRPLSFGQSTGSALLSKIKIQQGPADFVAYLRKVQKPEIVEVGKLHKLRLLLRNETVAWIEDFIQQGGMREIVGLLNRIMEVEWREDHEDALLHENLLCLKALSTTARAIEYLDSVQADLFRKLLHLLFDPEKKGPSEFTTRAIITSVLLTYIESAPPADRVARARVVLAHLRDPEPKEEERPLPFVLEMRRERPYRVWCKEVVSVTKEVFWIFLHNLNVVALPADKEAQAKTDEATSAVTGSTGSSTSAATAATSVTTTASVPASASDSAPSSYAYMLRHFPLERPPVAAAPYVGGVEWDATNYLASHLDVLNAILACTPTADERNALRSELRISGWERCLGGSLRLCKEKFYGAVHAALRTWVAAAAEDGWDVRDVRFGPSPEMRKSPVKTAAGGHVKAKADQPPKLDMLRLDFERDRSPAGGDAWL